jgi:outer membrane protein assembly factor BamE (lipoprotein component of BamABCDE complex)
MSRNAALAALAAVTLAAGLSACSPITSYSGFQAIDSDPKDVAVGTDTKSTVRAKLGSPSVQSTFDPNVWVYVNQVKERVAFRRPKVTARNVTAIQFNKDSELVEHVNVYTLKDGKVIAYNNRETPTRGSGAAAGQRGPRHHASAGRRGRAGQPPGRPSALGPASRKEEGPGDRSPGPLSLRLGVPASRPRRGPGPPAAAGPRCW